MRRDATLAVKIWIVASVLLMFGAIGVRDLDRRALMRSIGELSLAVSVMVGYRQCQSRDSDRPI